MKTRNSFNYALFGTLALFTALQGCGDDGDDNEKPPVVKPAGGSAGTGGTEAGSDAGGSGATGGTADTPGLGGTGAEAGGPPETAGAGGGGGGAPPGPACDPFQGTDGCYNCPTNGEQEQWLNRCVTSDCEPFANTKARLPLLKNDGTLPNLPN